LGLYTFDMEFFQQSSAAYMASLAVAQKDLANRVKKGVQPEFPFIDLNSIVIGNVIYLVVCAVLYWAFYKNPVSDETIKPFMRIYNLVCVGLAGYCLYGVLEYKLQHPGDFVCNKLDTSPAGMVLGHYIWVFYLQKYWEFIDTWIFLMRNTYRQVSILHLYHHSSITVIVGVFALFDWSGDQYLAVGLNSFVHVLMYSHYFISSFGVDTWWKPYLTSMQLIQFLLIAGQYVWAYMIGDSCNTYEFQRITMIGYMISMLFLFGNFFLQSYGGKKKKSDSAKKDDRKKD